MIPEYNALITVCSIYFFKFISSSFSMRAFISKRPRSNDFFLYIYNTHLNSKKKCNK